MRRLALCAILACCLVPAVQPRVAAESNSSWIELGQAETEKNQKNGTVVFQPHLTLDENNARISNYRDETISASASLPAETLRNLGLIGEVSLVGRSARLNVGGCVYEGRVTAYMLSSDKTAKIFIQISSDFQPKPDIMKGVQSKLASVELKAQQVETQKSGLQTEVAGVQSRLVGGETGVLSIGE